MTKITPLQESLYDIVPTIHPQEKTNNLRNFVHKKGLFTGQTQLSDEVIKTLLLEPISDPDTKKELSNILSASTNLSALEQLITNHKDNIQHLLYGYKKLKNVLKIEQEIKEQQIAQDQLSMSQYIIWSSLEHADFKTIRKFHKIQDTIADLEAEKEALLSNAEVVVANEHHKLAIYAQAIQAGKLVQTPSVQTTKRHLREQILSGKTLLLSWPVGTGKTKMAIEIYQEILEAKKNAGVITNRDYLKMKSIPIVNGNEESSIRDLQTKPIQMSNKADTDQAFVYDEGHLTLCLKYGLPLIIDEANRTPPNFLSSLKKYWAFKAGDLYRDPITGESFEVTGPLQVLMTANEGAKYAAHTNKFQDQIEREVQREYIWYLPKEEIYDIFKAKLYLEPGIAYVVPEDLTKTLNNLVNFAEEINHLYLSGAEYQATGEVTGHKIKSTVLDTKRLLALVDRSKIWSKATFLEEINANLVNFISRVENDTDRKILCQIAYAKGLLWSENISALIKGSGLKETDFSFNEQEKVDTITGDRLVDPWELAVAGRKGKRNEKDISFEDLDFEDEGTLIKNIVRDINKLGVFTVAKDAQITTLLIDPQKSDLKTIFSALYTKVSAEKESSAERKQDIANLLSQAKSLKVELDEKWDSWLKEDEKKPEETSTAGARTTSQAEHKNMTTIEKERKSSAYEKLIELKIDTPENRAKIDAVKFGTNYVEIWGVKFSTEKLVPQGVQRQSKNQYGIYPSDQKGVRKADYKGEEEYYYDFDAYEAECKKQGKNAVMKGDLEKAMQSLVGDYKEWEYYVWWNILSILLWMSMSGHVGAGGGQWYEDEYGYLGSASPSGSYNSWNFEWIGAEGLLRSSDRNYAFPCVFLL